MSRVIRFLLISSLVSAFACQQCKSAGLFSCFKEKKTIEMTMSESLEYLEFHLSKNFPNGASKDDIMNQIILWHEAEKGPKKFRQLCTNKTISRPSCLQAIDLIAPLKYVIESRVGCTQTGYNILNTIDSESNWRYHREEARLHPKCFRLSLIDELIRNYAINHARNCLPALVDQFHEDDIGLETVNLLKKAMRYIYTKQYKSLVNGDDGQELEFIRFTRRIIVPTQRVTEFGTIIAGYLISQINDSPAVTKLKKYQGLDGFNLIDLIEMYLMNPCDRYIKKTEDLFQLAKTDLNALDNNEDITMLAEGNGLNFLMGEAIFQKCLEFRKREVKIVDSLILSRAEESLIPL